ncbi:hypothetical protein [Streptomyces sp. NPDC001401]|uniref:hypothetical protein n=1 Tax=Streptomyces sp. NPDC001401 TaxID=3364570 RepID=UPI0036887F12
MGKKSNNKKKKPRGGQREYQGLLGGTAQAASPEAETAKVDPYAEVSQGDVKWFNGEKGISGGMGFQRTSSFLSEPAVSRFDYPKMTHVKVIGSNTGDIDSTNTTEVTGGLGSGDVS